nr:ral guanine nucleotide dissociation stimulator-like [Dasypus novemcinctus]
MPVAGSSGSAVGIYLDNVLEAQDGQEAKGPPRVHEGWSPVAWSRPSRASQSFSSSPGCPEAPGLQLTSRPPQPGPSTCASSRIGSSVTSASGESSSSSSIQARATRTSRKRRDSRPRYKRHVGDRCFVRVALAEDSGHKVQSILVTDQDRAPAVIRKALEEQELAGEQPADYSWCRSSQEMAGTMVNFEKRRKVSS